MPRLEYQRWISGEAYEAIALEAVDICRDFAAQGYDLTLRQLYYQFIARARFPNSEKSYDRLGRIIDAARMSGILDWAYIVDRTRGAAANSHWESPADIIDAAATSFRIDRYELQPVRVEVWVEKEALAGVVARAANREDVAYLSCRGYASQSAMWAAARRLLSYIRLGQRVVILHLGDHDPSGIDMTRDNRDRLRIFMGADWVREHPRLAAGREPWEVPWDEVAEDMGDHLAEGPRGDLIDDRAPFELRRIALNMDQVRQYNPPPNPAKVTDSRAGAYIERFGTQSWELDALSPADLETLIRQHITAERDEQVWEDAELFESSERAILSTTSRRWNDVVSYLNSTDDEE